MTEKRKRNGGASDCGGAPVAFLFLRVLFFQSGDAFLERGDFRFSVGLLLAFRLDDVGGCLADELLVAELLQHALELYYTIDKTSSIRSFFWISSSLISGSDCL